MWLTATRIHLVALALTLLVEGVGIYLVARTFPRPSHTVPRIGSHTAQYAMMVVLLTNLLVHTLFWQLYPRLPAPWPWSLYWAELAVVVAEALVYQRVLHMALPISLTVGFLLNLASLLLGLWIWGLV